MEVEVEEGEEEEEEERKQRCGGENSASSPASASPSISMPSSRPPRFASRAPKTTPPPQSYSSLLLPGPGAAFERIAERAEALRKPGDD